MTRKIINAFNGRQTELDLLSPIKNNFKRLFFLNILATANTNHLFDNCTCIIFVKNKIVFKINYLIETIKTG